MNMIYSNKEVSVFVGKLQGYVYNMPYDLSFFYQQSKEMFSSNGSFYPFTILAEESQEGIKLSLLSFADNTFKGFKIQQTLAIFVCVNSKEITKENAQQTALKIITSLDIPCIIKGVKNYNDAIEKEAKEKYYVAQFSNIDNATEAAAIIAQADNSYLLKENGKYLLIWNLAHSANDFMLAQVHDFADTPIHSLTPLQLWSKLEYADNIIIKDNAVQHLSCIY